jgi:hypothetical protein
MEGAVRSYIRKPLCELGRDSRGLWFAVLAAAGIDRVGKLSWQQSVDTPCVVVGEVLSAPEAP